MSRAFTSSILCVVSFSRLFSAVGDARLATLLCLSEGFGDQCLIVMHMTIASLKPVGRKRSQEPSGLLVRPPPRVSVSSALCPPPSAGRLYTAFKKAESLQHDVFIRYQDFIFDLEQTVVNLCFGAVSFFGLTSFLVAPPAGARKSA